jgi:uncharacterized repeat protein (TIGR01451 family)
MTTGNTRRSPSSRAHLFIILGALVLVAVPLLTASSNAVIGGASDSVQLAPQKDNRATSAIRRVMPNNAFELRSMSPFAASYLVFPPVPQGPGESITTYDSTCTTPQTDFDLGATVCAKFSGAPLPVDGRAQRRIGWVSPYGSLAQGADITTDPQNGTYLIPTSQTQTFTDAGGGTVVVDNRGTWSVNSYYTGDGSLRASAFFTVHDPATPYVDLAVTQSANQTDSGVAPGSSGSFSIFVSNRGPDAAQTVTLTDTVPANTTFSAIAQTSGPTFSCTTPTVGGTGTITCTIASLARGDTASFDLAYNVNATTPVGTAITNTATISSATAELMSDDNSSTASVMVRNTGGGGTGTCTVNCPEEVVVVAKTTDADNHPGAVVHFDPPTGDGVCGTITTSHCNDCFFPQGTTIVTATASTGDSCSFSVTVTPGNGNPPVISCPANQSGDANTSCLATFNIGTATATSGTNVTITANRSDGEPVYTCDDFGNCTRNSSDAPFGYGVTTITWIASSHDIPGPYNEQTGDEESHRTGSSTCTQTITVNDVTPPTISATNGSASADANCQAPVPDYSNTVSDNCSSNISYTQDPAAGTMVGRGPHTVHITANDGSSNNNGAGNTSTKDVTFTVNDTTPPTIQCPANISVPNTPGTCNASVSPGVATATDNCDGTIVPTATRSDGKPLTDPFPVGSTTIHWTATDSAGNSASCDQTVVILDNQNPTITCPANITTNTDPGACSATVNPGTATATDNCGGGNPPTVTGTRSDGQPLNAPYPKGTTTIHWTATDSAGNSSSCDQTVTVNDNEAPAISCPANITRSTDAGSCSANINPGTATATDNCGSATVTGTRSDSQALNAPYPKGTTTITWTATDSSGNHSSCTQTITVNDTEPPAISCPANIVTSTEPGTCSAHVVTGAATATDNCGTATVSGTRSDGRPLTDTYPKGTTTITWTATDGSGNQSSCAQTVTVKDTQAPTITFNGQTPSMWPPNHNYQTFTAANFISSVSDNCDSLSVSDVYITSATSDEVENGAGDGTTLNDIVISGNCKSIQLRAERQNAGNGRVYTIYFKLKDSSGNFTTGSAKVYSPKNEGETPGDDGPHYTVTSSCP